MDPGSGGGGPDQSGRLESFKEPRDLTLSRGGLTRSRRSYVPNIPPKRDRQATSAASTSSSSAGSAGPSQFVRGRHRPNSGAGRGGRERKPKPLLIQSDSIFSEGVGVATLKARRTTTGGGGGGGRGGGGGGGGGRGGSRIGYGKSDLEKLVKRQSEPAFQRTGSELSDPIGGDGEFVSDLDQDSEIDKSLQPISLPLSKYRPRNIAPITLTRPAEPDVKIKTEPGLEPDVAPRPPIVKPPERPMPTFEASSFPHALLTAPPEGTLVYFQMPNKLPVLAQTPASDSALIKETKLSSDIGVLPEGYIGKMQILASGRTRFILGDNSFDIEPGTRVSFRQELAAVDTERNKMTNLGPVKHKFNCLPDLESMMRASRL